MEIHNKINSSNINIFKENQKKITKNTSITFNGNATIGSSSKAIESIAKAKIALDNAYTKPIPYEEKIKILRDKNVEEKYFELFLSQDDDEFKKMLKYLDSGITLEQIKSIYNPFWGSEYARQAAELSEFNIPFDFARDLYSFYKVPQEKIEFLKQAKFDFSNENKNFKIDKYRLKDILCNEDFFKKFNSVFQKRVDANVALAALNLNDDDYQKLLSKLDSDNTVNNSATSAYFIYQFTDDDINTIIEASKENKLDFNNYDFWINSSRSRGIKNTAELLRAGVPIDCLEKDVYLNDEQIIEAISSAKKYNIAASDAIFAYQFANDDEQKRNRIFELIKEKGLDCNYACRLAGYDNNVVDSTISYMERGIDFNNSLNLALLKKDDTYKERVIELLDVLKNVCDAQTFLNMNLSEEDSAKALDLLKKGANLYFVSFCMQSPAVYEKACSLYDSGVCDSLDGLYGGINEEEVLTELEYIARGVPKEKVSQFLSAATPEQIDLLNSGVMYEALAPLKEYEGKCHDCTFIKEYLKKGISFDLALNLKKRVDLEKIPNGIVLDNVYKSLNEDKIIALSKIQMQRGKDWITGKDKDILIEFISLIKDLGNLVELIDLGFINEKALLNYNEFVKRGIPYSQSNNAIILSQLEFQNSAQFDRATELLKRGVPFEKILFAINDDKSFMEAINSLKNDEKKYNNFTLNSNILKLYKNGLNKDDINFIVKNCDFYNQEDFDNLLKYINKGHSIQDAVKISGYCVYMKNSYTEINIEKTLQDREFISDMILKGCKIDSLFMIVSDDKKLQRLHELLAKGYEPKLAEKIVSCNISPTDDKKITKIKEFQNTKLNETIKKMCTNTNLYPFIDELYSFENYIGYQYANIINSNISLQDILNSAIAFVKSPLKQAMKRPNMYLSGIPIEDTEKVNGKYPKLSEKKMQEYRTRLLMFFKSHMVEITRALKYLDVDTFNQLMDKRTINFSEQLEQLNKMDNKHYELVSKITKCLNEDGKPLSSKEKIDLAKIILYHQLGYIDIAYIEEFIKSGIVNISQFRKTLFNKLIDSIGLSQEEVQAHTDKLNFDNEYVFLLLRTQNSADFMIIKDALQDKKTLESTITTLKELLSAPEELAHNGLTEEKTVALIDLLNRASEMEEKDIYKEFSKISPFALVSLTAQDIAKIAILNDFNSYIQDVSNPIGKINAETKAQFEELGLNYNSWLNFVEEDSIVFNGQSYGLKLWDRNPQKDLFMGNRTSCCTAIIEGGNGKATPIYLANTAFNVIELTDENGNIVAMSRIFVAIVDNKPSIIVENIEINNSFLKNKTPEELKLLRDKMFEYVENFSKELSNGKKMDIYFSKNYTYVPISNYKLVQKNIDFVGSISSDNIYLNCKPGWVNTKELKNQPCELYLISQDENT